MWGEGRSEEGEKGEGKDHGARTEQSQDQREGRTQVQLKATLVTACQNKTQGSEEARETQGQQVRGRRLIVMNVLAFFSNTDTTMESQISPTNVLPLGNCS